MPAIVDNSVVLPVTYARGVIQGLIGRSKALELGYRLPDMIGRTHKLNVISALPIAGWIKNSQTTPNEESYQINRKPLSVLAYEGVDVVAEEIAVIVPISINTLKDTANWVDLAGVLQDNVIGAFQQVIDETIFFGANSPFTNNLQYGIVNASATAGAVVSWDGSAGKSFYNAISEAMKYVEMSGYLPDAIVGGPALNSAFRGAITDLGVNTTDQGQIGALYRHVCLTGGWDTSSAFAIVGDFKRGLVYAFRDDMEMRLLTEATLVDPNTGATLYNLAQQDMVAFRFTMRLGAAIANPVNRINSTAKRFPFAVITAPGYGSN